MGTMRDAMSTDEGSAHGDRAEKFAHVGIVVTICAIESVLGATPTPLKSWYPI